MRFFSGREGGKADDGLSETPLDGASGLQRFGWYGAGPRRQAAGV